MDFPKLKALVTLTEGVSPSKAEFSNTKEGAKAALVAMMKGLKTEWVKDVTKAIGDDGIWIVSHYITDQDRAKNRAVKKSKVYLKGFNGQPLNDVENLYDTGE